MSIETTQTPKHISNFFSSVQRQYEVARAKMESDLTLDYCIADRVLRLEFAGSALREPLTRALEHLRLSAQTRRDFTIKLWDIGETGVLLPSPPWGTEAYLRRGEVAGFNEGSHYTMYHPDSRILFVYDARTRTGYLAAFDHTTLKAYERAAALRPILSVALAQWNTQYVHAAAIGLPEGGVLLAGKSGAGKSTTALSVLKSELFYAADDYCAVQVAEQPVVHSLYNSAKASNATIQRLAFLEPMIQYWDVGGSEKAIFFLAETCPERLIRQFPLRAILIPRITEKSDTHLSAATSHAALLALAPSTVSQLANADLGVFQRLAHLVRLVPSYYLDLGTEMSEIPQAILKFLRVHNKVS
jgi:hypothetical protein